MALIIFGVTRGIIWAIVVCLGVIYHDSVMFPIQGFYCCPARTGWRFRQSFLTWFICSTWSGSAVISGMSWGTSVWGWSSVWGDTAKVMSTVAVVQSASIVASTISMMWPGMASEGVVMTMTPISMWLGLQPWSAVPISVPVVASRSWSGAIPGALILSVITWGCAW